MLAGEAFSEPCQHTRRWVWFARLAERFSTLLNPVIEANSLANTDNILGVDGGLDVNPIYEDVPETNAELAELRENVMGNTLFENLLFTEDGKRTGIYLELALDQEDSKVMYQFLQIVKKILEDIPGTERHYIASIRSIPRPSPM